MRHMHLIGPREAAARLGVSPARVSQLRREHRIRPAYTGPRMTLYRVEEIERIAAERQGEHKH